MGTRDQELLQQLNLEPLWMPFTANRQTQAHLTNVIDPE